MICRVSGAIGVYGVRKPVEGVGSIGVSRGCRDIRSVGAQRYHGV